MRHLPLIISSAVALATAIVGASGIPSGHVIGIAAIFFGAFIAGANAGMWLLRRD